MYSEGELAMSKRQAKFWPPLFPSRTFSRRPPTKVYRFLRDVLDDEGMRDRDKRREMICFVHIEKAAGTTLHQVFQANDPGYVVLTPFFWPVEPRDVLTAEEARAMFRLLPFCNGFGGHSTRSYLGYQRALERPVRYVTFLREPVSRTVAHINHQRTRMSIDWTVDDFLREPRLRNLMTRKICGYEDLDEAKRALTEDFAFVGLTEKFDASLVIMKAALGRSGMNLCYEKANTSEDPAYAAFGELSTARVRDLIAEQNPLDMALYDYAVRELWPRNVQACEIDVEAEAARLAEENRGFQLPRWKRYAARGYHWLVTRNIEASLRWRHHPNMDPIDGFRARTMARIHEAVDRWRR